MMEHEMCCGTTCDKQQVAAEFERIAERNRSLEALLKLAIKERDNLQIMVDANLRVNGRLRTMAIKNGYSPAGEMNEQEYLLNRFDEIKQERDEALAAYEHVCNVALQCTAIVESADGCLGADLIEACNIGAHRPALTKLLTALKVKWNCPTVERGTNRYGLDVAYFRKLFNRELNRTLRDYRPDELARNLLRMARTADKSIIAEDEFTGRLKAEWQADALGDFYDHLQGMALRNGWGTDSDAYNVSEELKYWCQRAQEAGE